MTDDPPLISRVGEALWGERWPPAMADALDVRLDTIKAWRKGKSDPPLTVWSELRGMMLDRRGDLYTLIPSVTLMAEMTASKEARL